MTTAFSIPTKDFLFFLSYMGIHLDNAALAEVMDHRGLTDRETLDEGEMGLVMRDLGQHAAEALESLKSPAAARHARLMRLATGVVDLSTAPPFNGPLPPAR